MQRPEYLKGTIKVDDVERVVLFRFSEHGPEFSAKDRDFIDSLGEGGSTLHFERDGQLRAIDFIFEDTKFPRAKWLTGLGDELP